jgi:AcrR family transcriptional regulator
VQANSTQRAEGHTLDPRTERTLDAILQAAFGLLIDGGTDALTHAAVAAAANVSRTTLYKHFPDRRDLLRATLEHFGPQSYPAPTGALRADLYRLLELFVIDLVDDDRARVFASLIERSLRDEAVAAIRDELVCDGFERMRSILRSGIASGALRADLDVDLAADALTGVFVVRRLMFNDPVRVDQIDHIVDEFIRSHRHR